MAEDRERDGPEAALAEFHKKIKEAFEVFDHESNNTVDVREIGTIVRSLGCCPNEGELHDLIAEVEEEEPTGYIRFEKFLPVMTNILLERRYRPVPEDILLRAFEVLDPAKRGFLSKEELVKYMTEEDASPPHVCKCTYAPDVAVIPPPRHAVLPSKRGQDAATQETVCPGSFSHETCAESDWITH